jgi:exodeoxyribonuclease V alpha subunit
MPEPPKAAEESDFYIVEITEPEEGVAKLIEVVTNRIPRRFGLDPSKDVQVLCPMTGVCWEPGTSIMNSSES